MNPSPRTLLRFWSRVKIVPDGCWLWTGYLSQIGYAPFMWNAKPGSAHRFSFEIHKGPIPEGLDIDHICRVRHCVNPDHLRAISHRENILCGNTTPAKHAAQTHCICGHEFTPENTYRYERGAKRQCRQCNNLRYRRSRARREAELMNV